MKKLINTIGLWLLMMTALTCVTAYINGTFNISNAVGEVRFVYGMLSLVTALFSVKAIYNPKDL